MAACYFVASGVKLSEEAQALIDDGDIPDLSVLKARASEPGFLETLQMKKDEDRFEGEAKTHQQRLDEERT